MSSDWQTTTLGAVTGWTSGGTPKKDEPSYWGGNIPWISANSMHGTRYSNSDLKLTEEGLANGSRVAPEEAVLLLVRGGALHNRIPVGIATRPVAFNQDVKAIVAKKNLIRPWYLLYWLMGQENFLLESVVEFTGIGAGKLDTKRMQALEMPLPSLFEQDKIIGVAKALDDRITLLRETNATLEAIAQALFKSWFVDFDPVRARMEGRAPEGMDEATAALFPDSFEETALGAVPRGWQVMPFLEACDLQGGAQPPASTFVDTPRDGYVRLLQIRDFATDAHKTYIPDTSKLKKATEDDVLLGRYGSASGDKEKDSLGRVCRGLGGAYNVALMKIVPLQVGREFALQLVNDPRFYNYLQGVSSKAVQSGFSKAELGQYTVVVPPKPLMEVFELIGVAVWERLKHGVARQRELADLRDTLLPRLISGQLRLPEAQAEQEDALA